LLAFLYASQELDASESAAFEQRLSTDQEAREALAQAVQISVPLTMPGSAGPNPSYREKVRQRLQPSWWRRLLAPRPHRGHPLVWGALGAALAASVVFLLLFNREQEYRTVQVPVIVGMDRTAAGPQHEDRKEGIVEVSAEGMGDMASVWAELSNPDHVNQAVDGEHKRRSRQEDWRHFRRTMAQTVVEE